MKKEIINKAAEILYISGYAVSCEYLAGYPVIVHGHKQHRVNPFDISLEGKHQACVIIDWIRFHKNSLWSKSAIEPRLPGQTTWQHVLSRLEWCLQVLILQTARPAEHKIPEPEPRTEARRKIADTELA